MICFTYSIWNLTVYLTFVGVLFTVNEKRHGCRTVHPTYIRYLFWENRNLAMKVPIFYSLQNKFETSVLNLVLPFWWLRLVGLNPQLWISTFICWDNIKIYSIINKLWHFKGKNFNQDLIPETDCSISGFHLNPDKPLPVLSKRWCSSCEDLY